jgi:hypothetical protein
MRGKGIAMAKNQAELIEIGARVRYAGASAGTDQRSHGRVGTVRNVATRGGMIGRHSATARVAWSEAADDWNHVLLSELVVAPAS